jgi:hypothetical protein
MVKLVYSFTRGLEIEWSTINNSSKAIKAAYRIRAAAIEKIKDESSSERAFMFNSTSRDWIIINRNIFRSVNNRVGTESWIK